MSLRNRVVLPVVAFLAFAFLPGCSSNSNSGGGHVTPPPSGGFTNANLKGTYVFSYSGSDSINGGSPFAAVGTFTADGAGNISGGTFDDDDPFFGGPVTGIGVVSPSAYTITSDGRGNGKLFTDHANVGNFGIDFVLTSASHGLIIRFDGNGTGSGEFDLQSSSVTEANLTGYTFSLSGVDSGLVNPMESVGTFTVDPTTGNFTAGFQDFNDLNNSTGLTNLALTGSLTLGTGTTAGTASLTTSASFGTLGFDVWAVDATHLKMIETDGSSMLSGDLFTQQAALPSSTSTLVYTSTGFESGAGTTGFFSAGGFMTYDGSMNVTSAEEDFNLIDVTNPTSPTETLAQTTSASGTLTTTSGSGRYTLALNGLYNGASTTANPTFAGYPFVMGSTVGMVFMETDGLGMTAGTAFVQSAQTFGSGQGYGFNLTGLNPVLGGFSPNEVDDIAEFTVNSGGTLSNGVLDENNDPGPALFKEALGTGGTYTYDSPATGRGKLSYPTAANGIGTLNLFFYTIDSSTAIFMDADTAQIGVGVFEQQSTPSSSSKSKAAAAASRTQQQFSLLNGVVHAKARRNKLSK